MAEGVSVGEKRRHRDEDLESELDFGGGTKRRSWKDSDPIASRQHDPSRHSAALPSKSLLVSERDKEEWRARRFHYLAMDAYSRHKALVNHYLLSCGQGIEHFQRSTEGDRNDYSVLEEEHKFLWDPGDEAQTWEQRMAKAYYDKLFKEYAIADLTRHKENKIAMRWRTEKEVREGKGQFTCGNKHCSKNEDLTSWEVNFSYQEHSEQKNALVKLRLCRKCSKKLNYHKKCKIWGGSKDKIGSKKKKKKKNEDSKESIWKEKVCEERRESRSNSEEEGDGDGEVSGLASSSNADSGGGGGGSNVWNKPAEAFLEKSKTDVFNEYFKDMFL